jgi:hypothetical protein
MLPLQCPFACTNLQECDFEQPYRHTRKKPDWLAEQTGFDARPVDFARIHFHMNSSGNELVAVSVRLLQVTEPPLLIPAKLCAIQPTPGSSYRLAAKVIGYTKVAFALPDSCAGDMLGSVARFTPSVRTHFCRPTANCLSSYQGQ